jgi:hypothetical protein
LEPFVKLQQTLLLRNSACASLASWNRLLFPHKIRQLGLHLNDVKGEKNTDEAYWNGAEGLVSLGRSMHCQTNA